MLNNIVLFTESFPSGSGEQFLETEIKYLSSKFQTIYIVPKKISGLYRTVPANCKIVSGFSKDRKSGLFEKILDNDVIAYTYMTLGLTKDPYIVAGAKKKLISSIRYSLYAKRWVERFINKNDIDVSKTLFYTYWMGDITLGIGLLKEKRKNIKLISRVHGSDFMTERRNPQYIPQQQKIIALLDKVHTVSDFGREYLSKKFPEFIDKIETSRLGVDNPKFITEMTDCDSLTIVSCSFLVPVKRVDLIIKGIKKLYEDKEKINIRWVHIGGGPLETEIKKMATELLANIKFEFTGHLENKEVIKFYKKNKIDVFINVSEYEGGSPVSIMEAQSCGIPCIGTKVGGVPEIVNNDNGVLLEKDCDAGSIAYALKGYTDKKDLIRKKELSLNMWNSKFNADINYHLFLSKISFIFK